MKWSSWRTSQQKMVSGVLHLGNWHIACSIFWDKLILLLKKGIIRNLIIFIPHLLGSLAEGQDTHEARPSEGEDGNMVDSSQGGRDIHMENLKPQEEPATDITTDTVINGSQNSSSMQQEELSQSFSQPVAEDVPSPKVKDTQKERRSRGYTRRGRGRGKWIAHLTL